MAESKLAARGKGPKLPVILSANDFLGGLVVFRGPNGWTENPAEAFVAESEEAAERLLEQGQAGFRANEVVDPYLVEVSLEDGVPAARHFREVIRLKGPTIHPDLGKQAEF